MGARTRILVAVGICAVSVCAPLSVVSGAVGAASVPGIAGVWLAYSPASATSPNWTFVLHNNPGSTRVTGSFQTEFNIAGSFSAKTGKALIDAGVQHGTLNTQNFTVKFTFKSHSTLQTNHPTFRGTFDNVSRTTGLVQPNSQGTVRAIRCSYQTTAKAIAFCG